MIVSINQPGYLPWLGYFDRIARSDRHVVLDHVTLGKDGMVNRNKIRTPQGHQLLTVPIKNRGGGQPICEIETALDKPLHVTHLRAIQNNYARAPHFAKHMVFFERVYRQDWLLLSSLMAEITQYVLDEWNIKTPLVCSSKLQARGTKSDLNLNLCLELGATVYLSGPFGRDYLDIPSFEKHGIEVRFHDYQHPTYPQAWPGFEPFMTAIDALMNCAEFPVDHSAA